MVKLYHGYTRSNNSLGIIRIFAWAHVKLLSFCHNIGRIPKLYILQISKSVRFTLSSVPPPITSGVFMVMLLAVKLASKNENLYDDVTCIE